MMFPKKDVYKSKTNYKKYQAEHEYCEIPGCTNIPWLGPHHIVFRSQLGGDEDDNLIRLCERHHDKGHGPDSREVREVLKKLKLYLSHLSRNHGKRNVINGLTPQDYALLNIDDLQKDSDISILT